MMGGGRPGGPGAPGAPRRPMGGGPPGIGGPMMPAEKSKQFGPSFRRLMGELRPESWRIALVMVFAIVSVVFTVVGPKILGDATDLIFEGAVSQQLPPGVTQQQAVDALIAQGQTTQAEMLASMTLTPG